jgi:hypothetical protein
MIWFARRRETDYKKNNDFCSRALQQRIKESFERVVTAKAIRLCCRRANEFIKSSMCKAMAIS